jgi:hypothetical protein
MLNRLIEFINNNYPESNVDEYLNAKYINLEDAQLKQIAQAIKTGELTIKKACDCPAKQFVFHFGNTLILLKKDDSTSTACYQAELAWETDFVALHSARNKAKGFYFIAFEFDNNYTPYIKETDKSLKDQIRNDEQHQMVIKKVMPVLSGFMSAISP